MREVKTVYNVTGPNARQRLFSRWSTNVVNVNAKQLFASMRQAVQEGAIDTSVREVLAHRIDGMEAAQGTQSFATKYAEFRVSPPAAEG